MKCFKFLKWSFAAIFAAAIVSCTEDGLPEPAITTFGFYSSDNSALTTDYTASINGTTISVALPGLVDKSSLIPRFSTKNADDIVKVGSTVQTSGVTANNYTSPVTYTAFNSDESRSVVYTVQINSQPVEAPKLLSFGFYKEDNADVLSEDYIGTVSEGLVSISLPGTIDKSNLVARFTTNVGDVVKSADVTLVSQKTALDYSNPIDLTLTNFDGKLNAVYSVIISRKAASFGAPMTISTDKAADAVLKVNPKNNQPYLAYRVYSDDNDETRKNKFNVLTFNGESWANAGSKDSGEGVNSGSMALDFDKEGTPYVAYQSYAKSPKVATVRKLSGNDWNEIAGESLAASLGEAISTKVCFGVISEKDMIVSQINNSRKGSFERNTMVVSKYNGSDWNSSYHPDFGSTFGYLLTMTSSDDAAYLMALSRESPRAYSLYKYAQGEWTTLRSSFIYEGGVQEYASAGTFALDCDNEGNLYVLAADDATNNSTWQIRIEKYDIESKTWSVVGGTPLPWPLMSSNGGAASAFSIAPDGTPYVAVVESGSDEIKVCTINPETLQWSEGQSVTTGYSSDLSIDFTSTGIMYISYTDNDRILHVVEGK